MDMDRISGNIKRGKLTKPVNQWGLPRMRSVMIPQPAPYGRNSLPHRPSTAEDVTASLNRLERQGE